MRCALKKTTPVTRWLSATLATVSVRWHVWQLVSLNAMFCPVFARTLIFFFCAVVLILNSRNVIWPLRHPESSDENKVICIAKCDVFSGACESIWYLRAFLCESLYTVYTERAASYLPACRAAVGLYSCTAAWLHVRNCQHILYFANQILLIANQLAILAQKCESSWKVFSPLPQRFFSLWTPCGTRSWPMELKM